MIILIFFVFLINALTFRFINHITIFYSFYKNIGAIVIIQKKFQIQIKDFQAITRFFHRTRLEKDKLSLKNL